MTKEQSTALEGSVEEVTHAVAEITKMDATIAELEERYGKVVFDVTTADGMRDAKAARKAIREPRYLIENLRKEGKAPILELGRRLDARAHEMKARLQTIEDPIHGAIKDEEDRAERERQAKIEAEEKRVESIKARIETFHSAVEQASRVDTSRGEIDRLIANVEGATVDETFEEFEDQARDARTAALTRLRELSTAAQKRDEERAELERLRKEAEKREAEDRKRQEAEDKKRREAEESERKRLEKQRAEQEARDKEQREREDKLRQEREAFEKQQREEAERKAKEEAERKAAEKAAQEAARKAEYPGDAAIVSALAEYFDVPVKVAESWFDRIAKAA